MGRNTVEVLLKLGAQQFRREARAARGSFKAATNGIRTDSKKLKAAFTNLDIRSLRDVDREARKVRLSYQRLATSGTLAARDLRRANRAMKGRLRELRKEARGTQKAFAGLRRQIGAAFAVTAIVAGIRSLERAADRLSALVIRVRTATKASGDFALVWKEIGTISRQTGTDLATTVSLFQGLARSGPELEATNAEMLRLTRSVQQLAVISGTERQNARAGLIQLSQGLASNVFRAEEFNSILENLPEVATRIAKGLGVSVGKLRRMVILGQVSSRSVFESLLKQSEEINAEFAKIPPTVERAVSSSGTSIGLALNRINQQLGITAAIARRIQASGDAIARTGDSLDSLAARRAKAARQISLLDVVGEKGIRRKVLLREIDALDTKIIALNRAQSEAIAKGQQSALQRGISAAETKIAVQRQALAEAVAKRQIELRKEVLGENIRTAREAIATKRREVDRLIAEEERGAARIIRLRQDIANIQATTAERIRDLRRRDLTDARRQADIEAEAADKIKAARQAAASGDRAGAEQLLNRLNSLAGRLSDTDKAAAVIQTAAKLSIQLKRQEITAEQQASVERQKGIAQSKRQLDEAQTLTQRLVDTLASVGKVDATIKIKDNIDQEIERIRRLKRALSSAKGFTTIVEGARAVGRARGGRLPGYGGGDRIPAVLEAGEFVIRKEAVRAYGPAIFERLNALSAAYRARGGPMVAIPAAPRHYAAGGAVDAAPADTVNLRIDMGARSASLFGARDQVRNLVDALTEVSRGG